MTEKTTDQIMTEIARLQGIQKSHRYDAPEWQEASAGLAPLFAEMARRQKAGQNADVRHGAQ